ncbi:hypothetical protein, partial [Acidovorax sp. PRC11]
ILPTWNTLKVRKTSDMDAAAAKSYVSLITRLVLTLAVTASFGACSRATDAPEPQTMPSAQAPTSMVIPNTAPPGIAPESAESPTDSALDSQSYYRYLYAVYCNGVVDRIDLEQRKKVASFHLAERSGTPAAVAAESSPGARPDSCLARPVSQQNTSEVATRRAYVVATDQFYRVGDESKKRYQLLTFLLPKWQLEKAVDLGLFDVLNSTPPRVVSDSRGGWVVLPQGQSNGPVEANLKNYLSMDNVTSPRITEWSASTALVEFANTRGQQLPQAGLADLTTHRFTRLDAPPNDLSADVRLAPGGHYALRRIERMEKQNTGGGQVTGTGELRLYGADGKTVATFNEKGIAGLWHTVALTPQGLAVYTNGSGDYQFVPLGRKFEPEPVANEWTDDLEGTRPGVVYSDR